MKEKKLTKREIAEWWKKPTLKDYEPAFLICGLEPRSAASLDDLPPEVRQIMERLLAEVPHESLK